MANLKIYSVFDSKAEAYLMPFFSQTQGTAVRSFISAVAEEGNLFRRFAEDYTLFELGEWDQRSAEFHQHESPKSVVGAWTVKATEEQE